MTDCKKPVDVTAIANGFCSIWEENFILESIATTLSSSANFTSDEPKLGEPSVLPFNIFKAPETSI